MSLEPSIEPMSDPTAAEAMLRQLWSRGLPNGSYLTVAARGQEGWTASQFREASAAAADLACAPDRHLTMGAMRRLARGRGGAKDVMAIPGFWADVDTVEGKHARQDLPTRSEAMTWLKDLEIPPSMILASGGGLYALWLFDEPWVFASEKDRALAGRLSKFWQEWLSTKANERGWHLDNTSSLAQCLRAVGTLNGKYSPPRIVTVLKPTGDIEPVRYARTAFEALAATATPPPVRPRAAARRDTPPPPRSGASWLRVAADALGGSLKVYDDAHGGGIVLRTCPFCDGRESAGTVVEGTAHIASQSGELKCKRASCDAAEPATFGMWIERVADTQRSTVRLARARSDSSEASWTDDGNAVRFFRQYGRDLYHVPACGWVRWDGQRFARIATTSAGMSDAVIQLVRELARNRRKPTHIEGAEQERAWERHRRDSQNERGIRAVVQLVRGACESADSTFDTNPLLLNVLNGTLDLATGGVRQHRREDRLTRLAGVAFDPHARCPALDAFLDEVTGGDPEFLAYLARCVGYVLAGCNPEDRLFLLHGPGGTGKSTFLGMLIDMLGDYAGVIPYSALVQRAEPTSTRPELLDMRGRRLVCASEAPDGIQLDAATLKSISGGDPITVRGLYRAPVTFKPTWTTMLAANHPPRLDPSDTGARRRIAVIPFEHAPRRPDLTLRDRLREPNALAALLAFAIRGRAELQALRGLGSCQAVERATARFWTRGGASTARAFVEARCVRALEAWRSTADIRTAAQEFARATSSVEPTDRELRSALEVAGFLVNRRRSGMGWRLRLSDAKGV